MVQVEAFRVETLLIVLQGWYGDVCDSSRHVYEGKAIRRAEVLGFSLLCVRPDSCLIEAR